MLKSSLATSAFPVVWQALRLNLNFEGFENIGTSPPTKRRYPIATEVQLRSGGKRKIITEDMRGVRRAG